MKTCCFTGHRELSNEQSQIIIPKLSHAIKQAIESGCDTFISGFAQGFDLLSVKLVLAQKKNIIRFSHYGHIFPINKDFIPKI